MNPSLIVSYSYSGNTHQIAQKLQKVISGDWCEIHPRQPYPMAFPELLEQAKREIRTGYYPQLLPGASSPRPYPVIFAGCPDWCGTIAPPLASWLHRNDLSGKIILPFYSYCGGAVGNIRKDIAKLCPKADIREPLGIVDDGGEQLEKMLQQWIIRAGITDELVPLGKAESGLEVLSSKTEDFTGTLELMETE